MSCNCGDSRCFYISPEPWTIIFPLSEKKPEKGFSSYRKKPFPKFHLSQRTFCAIAKIIPFHFNIKVKNPYNCQNHQNIVAHISIYFFILFKLADGFLWLFLVALISIICSSWRFLDLLICSTHPCLTHSSARFFLIVMHIS